MKPITGLLWLLAALAAGATGLEPAAGAAGDPLPAQAPPAAREEGQSPFSPTAAKKGTVPEPAAGAAGDPLPAQAPPAARPPQPVPTRVPPIPEPPIPPIPPIPVPASPVQQIVATVEALAKSDVPAARALAWDLAGVLAAHAAELEKCKVELPEMLRQLKAAPKPDAGRPTEAELGRIADQAEPLLHAATKWDGRRPPEETCPPRLGLALLKTLAQASPSAALRMAVAQRLGDLALPDPEGKRAPAREVTPALAAEVFARAWDGALETLAEASSEDAARALMSAAASDLVTRHLLLDAMASKAPERAGVEKRLADMAAQVDKARKREHPEPVRYALETCAARLEALKAQAGAIAERAALLAAVDRLAEKFLTAVNTENRAGALECLAAKSAEALARAESLRGAFTGRADTKDVLYLGLGPVFELAGRRRVTVLYRVIDTAGRGADAATEMGLVETPKGWLLGEP